MEGAREAVGEGGKEAGEGLVGVIPMALIVSFNLPKGVSEYSPSEPST